MLPDLVESQLLNIWHSYYSHINSFRPHPRSIILDYAGQSLEECLILLSKYGWHSSNLQSMSRIITSRFEQYDKAYNLSVSSDHSASFSFSNLVVKNAFNDFELNNIGLLMQIQIHFSSSILAYMSQFKDYKLPYSHV